MGKSTPHPPVGNARDWRRPLPHVHHVQRCMDDELCRPSDVVALFHTAQRYDGPRFQSCVNHTQTKHDQPLASHPTRRSIPAPLAMHTMPICATSLIDSGVTTPTSTTACPRAHLGNVAKQHPTEGGRTSLPLVLQCRTRTPDRPVRRSSPPAQPATTPRDDKLGGGGRG